MQTHQLTTEAKRFIRGYFDAFDMPTPRNIETATHPIVAARRAEAIEAFRNMPAVADIAAYAKQYGHSRQLPQHTEATAHAFASLYTMPRVAEQAARSIRIAAHTCNVYA